LPGDFSDLGHRTPTFLLAHLAARCSNHECMTLAERAGIFFPFVNELTDASRTRLNIEARVFNEKRGKLLLSRGDRVEGAFLMLSGNLDVYTVSEKGRQVTMYRVRRGESCLFALSSVFTRVAYPAWVGVTSPQAAILLIPGGLVKDLHEREKAFRDWVFAVQSRRIFDLISSLEGLQTLTVGERLRGYLVRAADPQNKIRETHEGIAAYLGTAREVITRQLREWAAEGLVDLSRGCIRVTDLKELGAHPIHRPGPRARGVGLQGRR